MTTPESPDNGVLALAPPRVLLVTQPVVGAHVALSLASYDLIPDGEGATVEVDPPLAGSVELDDIIWLWLVGDATFLSSAFITDVNAKTRLRIPKGRLYSDQINKLFYTIKRGSSNVGKSEPDLTVLYNKIRPALKDRFPESEGHSELELRLADEIKNGVGPNFVSAQVCVSYPYCRAYDTITLKCNGEIMTYQVRPDEAPQPPNPGSPNPIAVCFTVTRAYLESAVRPGGKLHFSCTCTDQIGNTPDTDAVWSATQTVDEDLAGLLLPAALLREQLNDPDDDLSVIDLEKLGPNPLLLIILTADSRFRVGYTVNAVYTATLAGQADVVVRVSGTVEADEFGQKKTLVLEVPNDKVPAGRTVTVMYELFNGTALEGRSKAATALVVGENTIEIDAPRLLAPATIPVDALDHAQGVNVRVDFAEAQPGDKAQLVLRNPLPGSPQFPELSLDQTFAIFNLDVVFLGLWHGKAPELSWDLIRGGKVIAQSLPLVLTVLPILSGDDRLPRPTLAGQTGSELDVLQLKTSDLFEVKQWLLQARGQGVWLRYYGFSDNGTAVDFEIWTGQSHNYPPSDLKTPLTAALFAWLKTLKVGSKVTVTFEVNFDKVRSAETKVTFPLRVYIVRAELIPPAPKVEEAPANTLDPIAAKDHLTVVVPEYHDMRSSDKISVIWSGTVGNGSHTSVSVEVGTVGIKKIPIPNTVVVFNLGLLVTVSYIVIRDGVPTPSLTLPLTVATIKNEDGRLPTPKILQAANNGDGPELDVSNLTAGATVRCLVWPLIAFGQPVWLHLRGKNAIGGEHNITLLRHPSNAVHYAWLNAGYYDVSVLYSYLKDLGDGSVLEVWFTAALDKGTDESKAVRFPVRRYTVRAVPALSAPTLVAPANNPIDPLDHAQGVRVRIDFVAAQPGDKAQLVLENSSPGSPEFPVLPLDQRFAIFTLDVVFLGLWHGKAPRLGWMLIREGKVIAESSALVLTVNRIAEKDPRLPKLAIDGAVGDVLDVINIAANAQLRVAKWLLQVSGQGVWLRYDGFDKMGDPVEHVVWEGSLHQSALGLVTAAAIAFLKSLDHESKVTITFGVNFGGVADPTGPVMFPSRIYSVKAINLVAGFEDLETESVQTFSLNSPVVFRSKLEFLLLVRDVKIQKPPSPYNLGDRAMMFTNLSSGRFSLPGSASLVELTVASLHTAGHTISFFDDSGTRISTQYLPITGDLNKTRFTYRAPPGVYVSYFEIKCSTELGTDIGFYADEFRWEA